ncbi:MAG: HD-GYP domain-containing protein, partial [Solirubrobacteraceae bacterium]
ETLLNWGRRRHRAWGRRLVSTEAIGAGLFIAGAVALAALGSAPRSLSASRLVVVVVAYLAAQQVRFTVGSAWTAPTQLVFVPMLFLLPTQLVPLIVAACSLADQLPRTVRERPSLTRLLARVGDSFYSLGPALVLVISGDDRAVPWAHWPVLVVALLAQTCFDAGAGLARTWFAERIRPAEQLPMLWLYLTDACLSCVGLLIADATVRRPAVVLLSLPLVGLLWLFARERRQRLDSVLELSGAYRGMALLLGTVVEADDHYTGVHSREVVELSLAIADDLGLGSARRPCLEFAALLHDVGKIRVPKEIINKPGGLEQAELEIVRRHTIDGEEMLAQVGGALASVGQFVRWTHEHYDGQGYPDGIAGDQIPIESRIVAVCDAFSAMTTDRAYRPAMPTQTALAELRRCAGSQFDPEVVGALERSLA